MIKRQWVYVFGAKAILAQCNTNKAGIEHGIGIEDR